MVIYHVLLIWMTFPGFCRLFSSLCEELTFFDLQIFSLDSILKYNMNLLWIAIVNRFLYKGDLNQKNLV